MSADTILIPGVEPSEVQRFINVWDENGSIPDPLPAKELFERMAKIKEYKVE